MTNILENFKNIAKDPHFYVIAIITVIVIAIGPMVNKMFQGKMTGTSLSIGKSKLDLWSLSHVLLYIYFGFGF